MQRQKDVACVSKKEQAEISKLIIWNIQKQITNIGYYFANS